jgi:hypothetical protein
MTDRDQFFKCEITFHNATKQGETKHVVHEKDSMMASLSFDFPGLHKHDTIHNLVSVSVFLNDVMQIACIYMKGVKFAKKDGKYIYSNNQNGLSCLFTCGKDDIIQNVNVKIDYIKFMVLLRRINGS